MKMLRDRWAVLDKTSPEEAGNKFSTIAAIVRDMTDEEAFEAMITENLQRKDVDPIEEGYAFLQLLNSGKSLDELSVKFGKSTRYIQDRIKLNNLVPELMLAVREGKMALGAAMLIAKLNEEQQKKYYNQYCNNYQGLTKRSAQSFVQELFLTINNSLWYELNDNNFTGGCGRACSECQSNTSSHGCLFWEMKSEDAGKCTDRAKYWEKTLAYMLSKIDQLSDELVKESQPLEFGKTVLGIDDCYLADAGENKAFISRLKAAIAERGFNVVKPRDVFRSKVYYDFKDDRTQGFLKNGEAYRCLNLFSWGAPELELQAWYTKNSDSDTNVANDGTPYEVKQLVESLKRADDILDSSLAVIGVDALCECTPSEEALTYNERALMLTCMLCKNITALKKCGFQFESNTFTNPKKVYEYVIKHRGEWDQIMRTWLFEQMSTWSPILVVAEPILEELIKANCPELYEKKKAKELAKRKKGRTKIEKRLKELGYGPDGKKLEKPKSSHPYDQYEEMKKKHPEAIIFFRVGDLYETYSDDAKATADVLNLTIAKMDGGDVDMCSFQHHALDLYLPRLTRAGKRVAICEQKDEPKGK